jgi:rhodanese-related sulfurtransferase
MDAMSTSACSIPAETLIAAIGTRRAPQIIDVRKPSAFAAAETVLPTAIWRPHGEAASWGRDLAGGPVVVYCVHGHQVSQAAAALLRAEGIEARHLAGGIDAYAVAGGPLAAKDTVAPLAGGRWVLADPAPCSTLAAAWFVRRFIDPRARIDLAEAEWATAVAKEIGAQPLDTTLADLARNTALHDAAVARMAALVASEPLSVMAQGLTGRTDRLERALDLLDTLFDGVRAAGGGT